MALPVFYGEEEEDAYWWILCVEKFFKEQGTRETLKVVKAITSFRGHALRWWIWRSQYKALTTWDTFTTVFLFHFKPEWREILPIEDEEMEPTYESVEFIDPTSEIIDEDEEESSDLYRTQPEQLNPYETQQLPFLGESDSEWKKCFTSPPPLKPAHVISDDVDDKLLLFPTDAIQSNTAVDALSPNTDPYDPGLPKPPLTSRKRISTRNLSDSRLPIISTNSKLHICAPTHNLAPSNDVDCEVPPKPSAISKLEITHTHEAFMKVCGFTLSLPQTSDTTNQLISVFDSLSLFIAKAPFIGNGFRVDACFSIPPKPPDFSAYDFSADGTDIFNIFCQMNHLNIESKVFDQMSNKDFILLYPPKETLITLNTGNAGVYVQVNGFCYERASGTTPRARTLVYKAIYTSVGTMADVVAAIDPGETKKLTIESYFQKFDSKKKVPELLATHPLHSWLSIHYIDEILPHATNSKSLQHLVNKYCTKETEKFKLFLLKEWKWYLKDMKHWICASTVDKNTSLAWIIYGSKIFFWSYLSLASSMNCVVLEIPLNDVDVVDYDADSWLVSVVNCDSSSFGSNRVANHVAVFLCNRKPQTVIYWPDIYSQSRNALVTSLVSFDELEAVGKKTPSKKQTRQSKQANDLHGLNVFISVIAFEVPSYTLACVALSCSSSGEFRLFKCSPTGICRRKVYENIINSSHEWGDLGKLVSSKGFASGYAFAVMPSTKGMVPENRSYFIGTYWGAVSIAFYAEIVESADAYLFLGPIFNDSNYVGYLFLFKKEKVIILQLDSVVIGNGPVFGFEIMEDLLKAHANNNASYENYHRIYSGWESFEACTKRTLRV